MTTRLKMHGPQNPILQGSVSTMALIRTLEGRMLTMADEIGQILAEESIEPGEDNAHLAQSLMLAMGALEEMTEGLVELLEEEGCDCDGEGAPITFLVDRGDRVEVVEGGDLNNLRIGFEEIARKGGFKGEWGRECVSDALRDLTPVAWIEGEAIYNYVDAIVAMGSYSTKMQVDSINRSIGIRCPKNEETPKDLFEAVRGEREEKVSGSDALFRQIFNDLPAGAQIRADEAPYSEPGANLTATNVDQGEALEDTLFLKVAQEPEVSFDTLIRETQGVGFQALQQSRKMTREMLIKILEGCPGAMVSEILSTFDRYNPRLQQKS